jgi:hypothetical protein
MKELPWQPQVVMSHNGNLFIESTDGKTFHYFYYDGTKMEKVLSRMPARINSPVLANDRSIYYWLEQPEGFVLTKTSSPGIRTNLAPACAQVLDRTISLGCSGGLAGVQLNGSAIDPDGDVLTYQWRSDCPGARFDDPASPTPILSLDASCEAPFTCSAWLTVSDGKDRSYCARTIEVGHPAAAAFIRGDCNGDGAVIGEVTDAIFLLEFNFTGGIEPPCLVACDANGDGAVISEVADAIYLLTFNFLGASPPPQPFPACGPDPSDTATPLSCDQPPSYCR